MGKKVVIFGSREFHSHTLSEITQLVIQALDDLSIKYEIDSLDDIEIITGRARGVDNIGYEIAKHFGITCHEFPADWDGLGKRAGYVRNGEMADFADIGLCFWNAHSRGTKHMLELMKRKRKPVELYIPR